MVKKLALVFLILALSGCVNPYIKTVYVPHGQAVRLRQKVKKVKVWVKTETGEIVPGKMDLPNGWYCLPLSPEKK